MLSHNRNSSNKTSFESIGQSNFIDLEGIGLATVVLVERARWGLTTPIELMAALLELVNDQRSAAKEGRCGE